MKIKRNAMIQKPQIEIINSELVDDYYPEKSAAGYKTFKKQIIYR